jgi:predicted lipoprotein with Yx(FWY)xxD motif
MRITTTPDQRRRRWRSLRKMGVTAATSAALVVPAIGLAAPAAYAARAAGGSVVAALDGPYGTMLIAASGPSAGTALYAITSDTATSFGCSATKQDVLGMPYVCTGPSNDKQAEWPAFTTTGTPVAGPGVSQSMLGEVSRAGIGEQVTYNGHPLYLFDSVPGLPGGDGWDEASIPADHGVWWLLSPSGVFIGSEGTLATVTIAGKKELAADMIDGGGVIPLPVYSFSKGTGCTAACAADFSPLYAQGSAGLAAGLPASAGLVMRADGTDQRTWAGKPLYLYSDEGLAIGPSGVAPKGNGNGANVDGGTFSLVAP